MGYLGKIVKATVLLAAVGVLLGLAAPALGSLAATLGVAPGLAAALSTTHPIWGGVFFGAFGAINAAMTPIVDAVFGDGHKSSGRHTAKGASVLVMGHAPSVAADLGNEAAGTSFQDRLGVAPSAHDSFQDKVAALRSGAQEQAL